MKFVKLCFFLLFTTFLLGSVGCSSSSSSAVPDAPPPYPSFPVPQERYNSANVYGGQSLNPPYMPTYNEQPLTETQPTPAFYTPPPSPPPTSGFVEANSYNRTTSPSIYRDQQVQAPDPTYRFSLEAKADLWALVQNPEGVELEWLKMKAGETANLAHSGALTITCSSGDQLLIKDKNGKPIESNPNSNGISIVRLPAD